MPVYTEYSAVPADNSAPPPVGAPEGMAPSAVNDTMRYEMAVIRNLGDTTVKTVGGVNMQPGHSVLVGCSGIGQLIGQIDDNQLGQIWNDSVTELGPLANPIYIRLPNKWLMQSGVTVGVTNASGFLTIPLPTTFGSVNFAIVVSNGDGESRPDIHFSSVANISAAAFTVRAANAGGSVINAVVRVNWAAFGFAP